MKTKLTVCCLLFALLLTAPPATAAPEAVEVPIIMYHKVTKDRSLLGKFAITPDELEADMQFIRQSGYEVVTMQALIDFVHGDGTLPEKPLVLSFDDGFFSDYHYVYPLAEQYQLPVVSSIIGKMADDYTAEGRTDIIYPHLLWPQIEEMAQSGFVEIQNHSYDLHCTRAGAAGAKRRSGESDEAYTARLGEDLGKLQSAIEQRLGTASTTFTYPFGAKSDGSDGVLQNLGFQASLMTEAKPNTVTRGDANCLFSMGRINRPHGRSLERILHPQ